MTWAASPWAARPWGAGTAPAAGGSSPPALSLLTTTGITATTATLGLTLTGGSGTNTLYVVVGPSSGWSDPSASEIKAGQLSGGGAATYDDTDDITSAGDGAWVVTPDASGLTAGVEYKWAAVASDGSTDSAVVVSSAFTTAVDITGTVALSGSVSVSGDLQIQIGSHDIAQTAAVALSGSTSVSGDIQPLAGALDIAQTEAVALSGSVSVSGDIEIGTSFDLAQTAAVAISGAATVSGDVQSSTEAVVVQQTGGGGFAWASPRKGRYKYLSPPTREQMAERVRKQREALGILPKPAQKRIEAAVKKEARRAEPSLAPLAPVAAEVAQDTGVALQSVVDAIQASWDYQRALVGARMQADSAQRAEEQRQADEQTRQQAEEAERQWQQRLIELRADDEEYLRSNEEARKQAVSTIRQIQKALIALLN